jgi:hypothetical protein
MNNGSHEDRHIHYRLYRIESEGRVMILVAMYVKTSKTDDTVSSIAFDAKLTVK